MQQTDNSVLLRQYAENHSDEAFAALVTRHIDLVYSVALRHVGDPHQAEEVAQAVFITLAKKAAHLRHDKALSSWLFQTTRLTASNFVRGETRRHRREQEAHMQSILNESGSGDWPSIAPWLDDAVAGLSEKDRLAIVLRFYEGRNLREVGAALGASEDAAQKRISRAVERLREYFAKQGITIGASGLVVLISSNAVQAAPARLAAVISTTAVLAGTAVHTSTITTTTKSITMTTLQKALTTVTVVAAVSVGILEARKASTLNRQNQLLQQQEAALAHQFQQSQHERDDASSKLAALRDANEGLNRNTAELLKLRGEVGRLKRELAEVARAKAQTDAQATLPSEPNDTLERQKRMARTKGTDAYLYVWAFHDYARENQGQLPTNWTQVATYLTNNPAGTPSGTNEFEMVYQGPLNWNDFGTNIGRTILIREYLAWPTIDGKWGKVYGFAGGSSEIHYEPDGDFTTWEKQFVIPKALNDK
jgi:RNA polymerase sigma factor (sigma-70 family)